jgi:hypothetical protein
MELDVAVEPESRVRLAVMIAAVAHELDYVSMDGNLT